MKENLDDYTKKVVEGLLKLWPEKFKKYVGIDANSVEEIACDYHEVYSIVKCTIGDYWEDEVSVEDAVNGLYQPLNALFTASASVM